MIGIRCGGVFSEVPDEETITKIKSDILEVSKTLEMEYDINSERLDWTLSKPLCGPKGDYLVIGGIFNYWSWSKVSLFAAALSQKLGVSIFAACWDEDSEKLNCQVFRDGKPRFKEIESHELF